MSTWGKGEGKQCALGGEEHLAQVQAQQVCVKGACGMRVCGLGVWKGQ